MFVLCSGMPPSFPPEFEVSLTIALCMVQQKARLDYAGRLPHQRDAGSQAVAKALIVQLRLQAGRSAVRRHRFRRRSRAR